MQARFWQIYYLAGLNTESRLPVIAARAEEKAAENDAFRAFLKQQPSATVDALVQELNEIITPQISCTDCGNCCRSLMINVTRPEVTRLAQHFNRTEAEIETQYIETSASGDMMVINTIPCHFLANNCCTIYEQRFNECREFPGLHQPHFTGRLFATFMHYGRCPIIYNVLEQLKQQLSFRNE